MTCGIYMIQNKVNGKIYIGQSVDIEKRWNRHRGELRDNSHVNKHLQNSWNIHGEDNFEFTIICECNENQLNTMEEYYIFELISYDRRVGYNKNYGGSSGRPTEEARKKMSEVNKGKTLSEETRKKMSEARKGENHPFYGQHHTAESRKKISESKKDKYTGENAPWYGKHLPEEARRKLSEANKGKHHSKETRKKMSETRKGKTHSEEARKKMSESKKGENNYWYGKLGVKHHSSVPVVQLTLDGELVKVYDAIMEAERSGFNPSNITSCIKGRRKTCGGYKWMYKSDYEVMKKEG